MFRSKSRNTRVISLGVFYGEDSVTKKNRWPRKATFTAIARAIAERLVERAERARARERAPIGVNYPCSPTVEVIERASVRERASLLLYPLKQCKICREGVREREDASRLLIGP